MLHQSWSIAVLVLIFVLTSAAVVFGIVYHTGDQQILGLLTFAGIIVSIINQRLLRAEAKTTEQVLEKKLDENTAVTKITAEKLESSQSSIEQLAEDVRAK